MSKTTNKKRSTIKEYSRLAPPQGFDHKKYAGRWVAESRYNERSDGYESRGFTAWKNDKDEIVKNGDLVWCFLTKQEEEARADERFEAAKSMMSHMLENNEAEDDRLSFELERAGGKLETKVEIN